MSAATLPTTVFVRIEGEPFLTRAREHIAAYHAWRLAWSDFAKSRGAEGHGYWSGGLNFGHRKPPEGWTKPKGQHGSSHPKKGHPDIEVMKALPSHPSAWDVFRDHFINTLAHEGPNGSRGMGTIGRSWNGADIGWISDDLIYARVPHPANAVANHLAQYPDHIITTPGAMDWAMPAGLTPVSQAQVDLWHAQAAVDEERADATPDAQPAEAGR